MQLGRLRVVHQLKRDGVGLAPDGVAGAFHLDTCQRRIWAWLSDAPPPHGVRAGEDAYLDLLLVACGLESEIVGETDVFGQLKDAWRAQAGLPTGLGPLMQKIFEDTKEIRSRHLEGHGGASYGTLARRLLSPKDDEPVLVVGAGRLARAVAPFFLESPVTIVNRSLDAAQALARELREQGAARVTVADDLKAERKAWSEAAHALICVPADAVADAGRVAHWSGGRRGLVLHLGCLSLEEGGPWASSAELRTLDNLFALRRAQDGARDAAARVARRTCAERARLRSLGDGSLSVSHGWEDLAAFA